MTTKKTIETYRLALRLLHQVRSWIRDCTATENGWDLHYAVDTDIVILYMSAGYRPPLYGDIFRDDDSTAQLVGRLLGDFLFLASKDEQRFIIFDAHREELFRILTIIARQVNEAATITSPQFDVLCRIFEEYRRDRDQQALLANLEASASSLVMLYDKNRGPKAMLDRFSLLSSNKILQIDRHSDPVIATLRNPTQRIKASDDHFLIRVKFWERVLKEHRAAEQPAYALLGDAEVLATLEFLNQKLLLHRKRILLITGSRYLFRAGRTYTPTEGNPDGLAFDALYLRHPQAFLAHPEFFQPSDASEQSVDISKPVIDETQETDRSTFKLVDWLGILFPKALRDSARSRGFGAHNKHSPSEFFGTVSESGRPSLPNLSMEWSSQVRKTALGRYGSALVEPSKSAAAELEAVISEMIARNEWSLVNFRHALSFAVTESLSQMYSHAVWFGLWSNQGVVLEHSKGVPKLRFDGPYKKVETYCATVLRLQARSSELTPPELIELANANDALKASDSSSYHKHVVDALAFATKGRWEPAIALCNLALNIADSLAGSQAVSQNEVRKGREAAYLAAIAQRRSAKGRSDLATAQKYLDEAINRENPGISLDVRFKSEAMAIRCREIYFRFYCEDDKTSKDEVYLMLKEIASIIDQVELAENKDVQEWVVRQCCTNYFNLLFILADIDPERIPGSLSLSILNRFRALLEAEKDTQDPHASVVAKVASALLGKVKLVDRESFISATLSEMNEIRAVRPYDRARTELFGEILVSSKYVGDALS